MAKINFQTNVAQEVRLRSIVGTEVESQFGGKQIMFSAEEGCFYVSETVGAIITEQCAKLGVKPGEPIDICKQEVARGGGRKGIVWNVAKVGFAVGERGDGTFAVSTPEPPSELEQQLAASIAQVEARKQAARAAQASPAPAAPKWAEHLAAQTKHLIDVYAAAVTYAGATHGNAVKAEDVRSLMLSAYIAITKDGAKANAA